jgi:Uma2 family endonuclease
MKTQAAVPVEEYLATTFHPDRDFLEGVLMERHVGGWDHGRLQALLAAYFIQLESKLGLRAGTEVRVQVKPNRFRVPDICLIRADRPREQIIRTPPFLCVEILSPEDTLLELQGRIDDYLAFGVPYVWLIDPWGKRGWVHTSDSISEAKDGVLRTADPEIAIRLAEFCPGED